MSSLKNYSNDVEDKIKALNLKTGIQKVFQTKVSGLFHPISEGRLRHPSGPAHIHRVHYIYSTVGLIPGQHTSMLALMDRYKKCFQNARKFYKVGNI